MPYHQPHPTARARWRHGVARRQAFSNESQPYPASQPRSPGPRLSSCWQPFTRRPRPPGRLTRQQFTCNHRQQQCSCLVCSSVYCSDRLQPIHSTPSARLFASRLIHLACPYHPRPTLVHSAAGSWHRGKSNSHSKHLQPPPYTAKSETSLPPHLSHAPPAYSFYISTTIHISCPQPMIARL